MEVKVKELKQPAAAGTLESGDILIELEPNEGKGLTIRLDSTVANQFGKRIKEVISETFAEMGVKDGFVDATDKGAVGLHNKGESQGGVDTRSWQGQK